MTGVSCTAILGCCTRTGTTSWRLQRTLTRSATPWRSARPTRPSSTSWAMARARCWTRWGSSRPRKGQFLKLQQCHGELPALPGALQQAGQWREPDAEQGVAPKSPRCKGTEYAVASLGPQPAESLERRRKERDGRQQSTGFSGISLSPCTAVLPEGCVPDAGRAQPCQLKNSMPGSPCRRGFGIL